MGRHPGGHTPSRQPPAEPSRPNKGPWGVGPAQLPDAENWHRRERSRTSFCHRRNPNRHKTLTRQGGPQGGREHRGGKWSWQTVLPIRCNPGPHTGPPARDPHLNAQHKNARFHLLQTNSTGDSRRRPPMGSPYRSGHDTEPWRRRSRAKQNRGTGSLECVQHPAERKSRAGKDTDERRRQQRGKKESEGRREREK